MEATTGCDILNRVPSDLLAAEILPWLTYGQLNKVTRVSKQFAAILKKTGSFSIDTFHEGWLDRTRVQEHIGRCRYLMLSGGDVKLLEHLASLNQNHLERLDVRYLNGNDDSFVQLIATIIKNNMHHSLKSLRVPAINFKKIVADNVICPSVHSLIIRNTSYSEVPIETTDILKVFPSLKRLELLESPNVDLYKYLCEHIDTPLEHVFFTSYDSERFSGASITAELKSLEIYLSIPQTKKEMLMNLSQNLTRLKVDLGYNEGFKLPKLKNLEWLEINSEDDAVCKLIENAKNLTHLTANKKLIATSKLPPSLKSIESRLNEKDFKAEVFTKLPNLESLTLFDFGSTFWTMKKGSLSTSLKKLQIECYINEWNPTMNSFVNLTHFSLTGSHELKKIPSQFFKNCTKLTHFSVEKCGITSISRKVRHLKDLEVFKVKGCKLTSIPEGLKELPHLRVLDLRNNPFTLEAVPLTLPVKTVLFTDREWIQLIQQYLVALSNAKPKTGGVIQYVQSFFEKSPAPTVAQMMKMPCLSSRLKLEEGRLARVLLHAFKVKGVELEAGDDDSDYLAGALMRKRFSNDYSGEDTERIALQAKYHDKATNVGIILFNEFNARQDSHDKLRLVRVEAKSNRIKTYALEVSDASNNDGGWFSRAVWKLQGYIHEFKDLKVTEKESKYIRSVVEPK